MAGANASVQPGRRVAVIGTTGSGKTYLAENLSKRLRIPYICNDAIIWRPDWVPTPRDQRAVEMERAARAPAWTFDGNFGSPEDAPAMERCDTVVWLNLPRWQVWPQVTWRTLSGLITKKPHWRDGNVERWRIFFSTENIIWWSIKTFSNRRRQYHALFDDATFASKTLICLRSRKEVDDWLTSVDPQPKPHRQLA